jgi:hypothetical protein
MHYRDKKMICATGDKKMTCKKKYVAQSMEKKSEIACTLMVASTRFNFP